MKFCLRGRWKMRETSSKRNIILFCASIDNIAMPVETYWKDIADWYLCFKMSEAFTSWDSTVKCDKGNTYWARFLTSRASSLHRYLYVLPICKPMPVRIAFSHSARLLNLISQTRSTFSSEKLSSKITTKMLIEGIALKKNWRFPKTNFDFNAKLLDVFIIARQ